VSTYLLVFNVDFVFVFLWNNITVAFKMKHTFCDIYTFLKYKFSIFVCFVFLFDISIILFDLL